MINRAARQFEAAYGPNICKPVAAYFREGHGSVKKATIVGATGDVGLGIVGELLAAGYEVVAVGRNQEKLDALNRRFADAMLSTHIGSVESREAGEKLGAALAEGGKPDVIVVSVNGRQETAATNQLESDVLERILKDNLLTHLIASQTLIPAVADGGTYLGIGGGMADTIFPGSVAISMAQSAQRTLFRYLAKEHEGSAVSVKELMLYAMINGESKRDKAEPFWITDREVGRHVVAVLSDPQTFEGPILALKSKKQIGLPERKPV